MIPKIAAALARVLDPIQPIERPGQSIGSAHKSTESGGDGHGALGYSGENRSEEESRKEDPSSASSPSELRQAISQVDTADENSEAPRSRKPLSQLPLQCGLTAVILELNGKRQEGVAGNIGVAQYESGAKDQKKASRLPKGSMLDKKAG